MELKRGRRWFFCTDKCRNDAFRKCKKNPELAKEYDAKRADINKHYAQAWVAAKTPLGLRKQAIALLHKNGWPVRDIEVALGISNARIRRVTRGDSDG